MNGDPLSSFPAGESSSGRRRSSLRPPLFPPTATEELSNFDAMFSGVSLRSLLQDQPILSSPSPFSSSSSYSSSSSPHWPPLPSPVPRYPPSPDQQQHLPFHYSPSHPLKMPKQEPRYDFPDFPPPVSSPFNSLSVADDSTICLPFHRLSDLLHSLETIQPEPTQPAVAVPSPARKRPADPERTKRAKEKRRKVNHCLRQLHELVLPRAERKMDTLTTLEEACKQVAYLQQLVKRALHHLVPGESPPPTPCFSPYCPMEDDVVGGGSGGGAGDGRLGRLRMQHLFGRTANSLPAQAMLINQEYGMGVPTTNQQWQLLKQREEEEEEAASEMRMEMQRQMWLNLEAPPNQSQL